MLIWFAIFKGQNDSIFDKKWQNKVRSNSTYGPRKENSGLYVIRGE